MQILDLSHCDRLDTPLASPATVPDFCPRMSHRLPSRPTLLGGASGVGSYATALAWATGKAPQTFARAQSWAQDWFGFGIAFSQGFATAQGSQSAQTGVETGGSGDFVIGGSYTQNGQGSSSSYGAVLAIDVPWV